MKFGLPKYSSSTEMLDKLGPGVDDSVQAIYIFLFFKICTKESITHIFLFQLLLFTEQKGFYRLDKIEQL